MQTVPIIFGSLSRYVQGPGALRQLPQAVDDLGAKRPALVADSFVRELLCSAWPEAGQLAWIRFEGECTREAVDAIVGACRSGGHDLLIAAGGGKSIDAAKGAQIQSGLPIFVVPTVSSTDAPTSRVAVLYGDDHRISEVRSMRANPDLVLVDTELLARAPRRFLVSGIGDALSKRFEAEQCIGAGGVNFYGGRQGMLAKMISANCFEVLMNDADAALAAQAAGRPTPAFERLIEASILLSGLACENAGLSVAHSLTRGLSAVPEILGSLHGEEVAFGLIVQLLLEREANAAMLAQLLPFYRRIGLPATLEELGVPRERISQRAEAIARISVETSPHIKHFGRPLTVGEVQAAILAASALP
jgi:glycerol dehydrogenase